MTSRIRGQVLDTITKAEVQKVMDLIRKTGKDIDFIEYEMDAKTLDIALFGKNAKKLRHYYDKLNKKIVKHPRMATNNLFINSFGLPTFDIFKCEDDWFWVRKSNSIIHREYFICDGIQGLMSMLTDHFMSEENKSNS